jgi:dipeptidyl-peptidase-3
MTFISSGIPAGINIPNYDDIRQNIGFKNVSLGNIIGSSYNSKEPSKYINKEDNQLYKKYIQLSFKITVAGHELLGHGSGKLFYEDIDKTIINPLTNKKITKWYNKHDTYSSVFGNMGSAYEECRAECIGLLFSNNKQMINIFHNNNDSNIDDLIYVSWLSMIRSGIISLASYDINNKKWLQAHSNARYVIYQMLNEIPNFINIQLMDNNFIITVNRYLIHNKGIEHLRQFLLKLQVYKSTADIDNAKQLFMSYSKVDDYHIRLRNIIINNKKPRTIYSQPTTYIDNEGNVQMKVYPDTVEGLIESFINNYPL